MTNNIKKKGTPVTKAIIVLVVLICVLFVFIFSFDRLVSNALTKYYASTLVAEVYDLKFEKLSVNLFTGNIKVRDVTFQPRSEPRNSYPYINSSVDVSASLLRLEHVELITLLIDKQLVVDRIVVEKPELAFELNGERNIFMPYPEKKTQEPDTTRKEETDIAINTFHLSEFRLSEASIDITNSFQENNYQAERINIGFENFDVYIDRGNYVSRMGRIDIAIGQFQGSLGQGFAEQVHFEDFSIVIDSATSTASADTIIYHFKDFKSEISNLGVLTADSLQQITMEKFDLSYRDQSIKIAAVNFEPNVSKAALQKRNEFQKVEVSGSFKTLELKEVNFDNLIYNSKLVVESVEIDSVYASLFKDRTKPLNPDRFPPYPPQGLAKFDFPVHIGKISATNSLLEHDEKLEDGTIAHVHIYDAFFSLENFSNLSSKGVMVLRGKGDLENAARFDATLSFEYANPQFAFYITVEPFDLTKLNPLVNGFTPMSLSEGFSDKVILKGTAQNTHADGTMEFLYHDLHMDINLEDKANWKSALLSFAGNTIVQSSNPSSEKSPARVVAFHIERDMNKAFLNVIIKSLLDGLKETLVMGKENRKVHQEKKKLAKNEN